MSKARCWFFGAIDHYHDELVGWHVAKLGDRWAALEPLRQGVRYAFGGFAKDIARGLKIRCDWGPQYIADAWINEVKWLGITISPSRHDAGDRGSDVQIWGTIGAVQSSGNSTVTPHDSQRTLPAS